MEEKSTIQTMTDAWHLIAEESDILEDVGEGSHVGIDHEIRRYESVLNRLDAKLILLTRERQMLSDSKAAELVLSQVSRALEEQRSLVRLANAKLKDDSAQHQVVLDELETFKSGNYQKAKADHATATSILKTFMPDMLSATTSQFGQHLSKFFEYLDALKVWEAAEVHLAAKYEKLGVADASVSKAKTELGFLEVAFQEVQERMKVASASVDQADEKLKEARRVSGEAGALLSEAENFRLSRSAIVEIITCYKDARAILQSVKRPRSPHGEYSVESDALDENTDPNRQPCYEKRPRVEDQPTQAHLALPADAFSGDPLIQGDLLPVEIAPAARPVRDVLRPGQPEPVAPGKDRLATDSPAAGLA